MADDTSTDASIETVLEPSVIESSAVDFRYPDRGEMTESTTRVKAGKNVAPKPAKTVYQPFHW